MKVERVNFSSCSSNKISRIPVFPQIWAIIGPEEPRCTVTVLLRNFRFLTEQWYRTNPDRFNTKSNISDFWDLKQSRLKNLSISKHRISFNTNFRCRILFNISVFLSFYLPFSDFCFCLIFLSQILYFFSVCLSLSLKTLKVS